MVLSSIHGSSLGDWQQLRHSVMLRLASRRYYHGRLCMYSVYMQATQATDAEPCMQ
jgi:hypothetical protein